MERIISSSSSSKNKRKKESKNRALPQIRRIEIDQKAIHDAQANGSDRFVGAREYQVLRRRLYQKEASCHDSRNESCYH